MRMVDGRFPLPQKPGLGFDLSENAFTKCLFLEDAGHNAPAARGRVSGGVVSTKRGVGAMMA
jgi:hypothetical protein